jgi:malate synthase
MDTVEAGGLSVAKALYDFMNDEALPETGLAVERFWDGLGAIIRGFAPRNRKLLPAGEPDRRIFSGRRRTNLD